MNLELRDRPVFICGHPKSGTSLLRSLFDSHSQMVVYPEETLFFRRYLPASQGLSLEQKLNLADECLIHIFTWNQVNPPPSQAGFPDRDYSSISYEMVQQEMRRIVQLIGFRHDGDLLSAAVLAYGQVTGQVKDDTLWWVEKTPYNERFSEQIFGWWPQARCIHMVRDPRDNYLSYRRKHPEWSPEVFATSWNGSTGLGLRNQERYGRQRYWILHYEELAQHPDRVIPELRAFLGIAEDEALYSPTRNRDAWQGNSMFANRFEQISDEAVDRWKKALSQEDAGVISLLCSKWMKRLEYPALETIATGSLIRANRWRFARWFSHLRSGPVS